MKVLLLVTALMSANGGVTTDTRVVEMPSMSACLAMGKEVARLALKDGYKLHTQCTFPRKLEDYK